MLRLTELLNKSPTFENKFHVVVPWSVARFKVGRCTWIHSYCVVFKRRKIYGDKCHNIENANTQISIVTESPRNSANKWD